MPKHYNENRSQACHTTKRRNKILKKKCVKTLKNTFHSKITIQNSEERAAKQWKKKDSIVKQGNQNTKQDKTKKKRKNTKKQS